LPLTEDAPAAHFTGRGPWKKRMSQIVDTLVSLGRTRRVADGVLLANSAKLPISAPLLVLQPLYRNAIRDNTKRCAVCGEPPNEPLA